MRSSVDLPQPDGPTSTRERAVGDVDVDAVQDRGSPKFFLTDWIVTLAIALVVKRRPPAPWRCAEVRDGAAHRAIGQTGRRRAAKFV